MKKCPEEFAWVQIDTIAECYDIPMALYTKIWGILGELEAAGKASPVGGDGSDGTIEEPVIGAGYADELSKCWRRFTAEEQRQILTALRAGPL